MPFSDCVVGSLLSNRTKYLIQFYRTVNSFLWLFSVSRGQAAKPAANLLARTRLNEPIKVGSPLNVEASMRAEGKPRRTLLSIFSVSAFSTRDHALVISPPTTTASGLKPTIRL